MPDSLTQWRLSLGKIAVILTLLVIVGHSSDIYAQFLQLGPFAFDMEAGVEAVYTTNVEGQRASDATADRDDLYGIWQVRLTSHGDLTDRLSMGLEAAIGLERHYNRPDLNNSQEPFTTFNADFEQLLGRFTLDGNAKYERTSSSAEAVFVPGAKKTRDVSVITEYGGVVTWNYKIVEISAAHNATRERHEQVEFENGDRDELTIDYNVVVTPNDNLSISYLQNNTKTDVVNDPNDAEWESEESLTITLNYLKDLLENPRLTYSVGVEKEDTDEDRGEWELIHLFTLDYELYVGNQIEVQMSGAYTIEDKEKNDVNLVYSADINHQIDATALQSFRVEREPVETFGSTIDTDRTLYEYTFRKNEFLIHNLTLGVSFQYELNTPLQEGDGLSAETEKTKTFNVELSHKRSLTRDLSRELVYFYDKEDSNFESEVLDEHNVSLSFVYEF